MASNPVSVPVPVPVREEPLTIGWTRKACACGCVYAPADWALLQLVGYQTVQGEPWPAELRLCEGCESTIGVPVRPEAIAPHAPHGWSGEVVLVFLFRSPQDATDFYECIDTCSATARVSHRVVDVLCTSASLAGEVRGLARSMGGVEGEARDPDEAGL